MNESLKNAQKEYTKKCKLVTIRMNRETEADLIAWVEANEGKAGTIIKNLIREEINRT